MRTKDDPHSWLNRVRFPAREEVADCVTALIGLLEALEQPHGFAVLLNEDAEDLADVRDYFEGVEKPVIEVPLGSQLMVVDREQPFDHARVDHEILRSCIAARWFLPM
ncbi:MAG: hypothetical protein ACTHJK_01185 [Sphingomicrobium sp.]